MTFSARLCLLLVNMVFHFNLTWNLTSKLRPVHQFVELPLQWMKTRLSEDRFLEIYSRITKLNSDKLEYSEVNFVAADSLLPHWKHWTFKLMSHQFQLMISKITMYYCLIRLQCKMHRKLSLLKTSCSTLRLELNFIFIADHATELVLLKDQRSLVAVDKCGVVGKKVSKWQRFSASEFQVSVLLFIPFTLCYSCSQWDLQHYAGWALENACKLSSQKVFSSFSRMWEVQFFQATLQADDVRAIAFPTQRLRFLYDICSSSSLHVWTRRSYWISWRFVYN